MVQYAYSYYQLTEVKLLNYTIMLRWSLIFFVVAIVAALFGFTGIAQGAASVAQVLFFIFAVLFVIALIAGGLLVGRK